MQPPYGPAGGWAPPPPPRARSGSGAGCFLAALLALVAVVVLGGAFAACLLLGRAPDRPVSLPDPIEVHEDAGAVVEPPRPPLEPPSDPRLPVAVRTVRYPIAGATAAELRAELDRLGPVDEHGRHDALTAWYVSWSYPYARGGSCDTGPVRVDVTVTYTMPVWSPPPGASPALVDRWKRYEAALEEHERGHTEFGVAAAREILRELEDLPPRPTCGELDGVANSAGHAILERYRVRERKYDTDTRHGATQGARFP